MRRGGESLVTGHVDSRRTTSIVPTPLVLRNQYAIAYNYWRRPSATIAGHRGWMRMHGLLFTSDFLREGIRHTRGWLDAATEFLAFREAIGRLVDELGDDVRRAAERRAGKESVRTLGNG